MSKKHIFAQCANLPVYNSGCDTFSCADTMCNPDFTCIRTLAQCFSITAVNPLDETGCLAEGYCNIANQTACQLGTEFCGVCDATGKCTEIAVPLQQCDSTSACIFPNGSIGLNVTQAQCARSYCSRGCVNCNSGQCLSGGVCDYSIAQIPGNTSGFCLSPVAPLNVPFAFTYVSGSTAKSLVCTDPASTLTPVCELLSRDCGVTVT